MKRKRKGTYDKSGGITHDTAVFAFRTKDILKIRSRPRLEPGSDYHYLVPVTGLEPVRGCPRGILSPLRLPIPPHRQTYKYVDDGFPSSGTYRARTYDPLLVRQMLSQLS